MIKCIACDGSGQAVEMIATSTHNFARWYSCRNCNGTGQIDTRGDEIVRLRAEIVAAVAAERARCAALATSLASALPRADRECAVLIMRLAETMEAG